MRKLSVLLLTIIMLTGCGIASDPELVFDKPVIEDEPSQEKVGNMAMLVNEEYGIQFQYFQDWEIKEFQDEQIYQVEVTNIPEARSSIREDDAHFTLFTQTYNEEFPEAKNFDEYFEMNHFDDPTEIGLGQFGGEYEKTTISDYPAYKVETIGFERPLVNTGYIVDYSKIEPGRVVFIVLGTHGDSETASRNLQTILGTLQLKN